MTLEQCKQEYKWRRSFLRAGLQGTPAQIDEVVMVALGTEEEYINANIDNEPLPQFVLDSIDVAGFSKQEPLPDLDPLDKSAIDLLHKETRDYYLQGRDINEIIQELKEEGQPIGQISDGYHTFDELYEFRMMYNVALFNEWGEQWRAMQTYKDATHPELRLAYKNTTGKYYVHKSWKHSDGEWCFGEEKKWFIVSALLPSGLISNHYKAEHWDLFKIKEVEKALFEYDGHTAQDVLERLKGL